MSILTIDEHTFDPLFDEIWHVWPQSWDTGDGPWNEKYIRKFSKQLMGKLFQRGGYFHDAICQAVIAVRIRDVKVPQEEFDKAKELANELVRIVRSIEPDAKYITIKYESTVSGGDRCLPGVEIRFDSEWFGKDYRTDKYGPWHERHSTCAVHVWWDTRNVQGYQNSRPDAKPMPRYGELYPICRMWAKDRFGYKSRKQDDAEYQVFFPEGESNIYFNKK